MLPNTDPTIHLDFLLLPDAKPPVESDVSFSTLVLFVRWTQLVLHQLILQCSKLPERSRAPRGRPVAPGSLSRCRNDPLKRDSFSSVWDRFILKSSLSNQNIAGDDCGGDYDNKVTYRIC